MTDSIILTNEQFSEIFKNAYAVVIDGCICDVYNDYENEDGELCTAFVEANDSNYELAYAIPREVEEGDVFLATFNYNNVVYGIDIVKDLTPEQIFNELL